jgi:hypothetical protein
LLQFPTVLSVPEAREGLPAAFAALCDYVAGSLLPVMADLGTITGEAIDGSNVTHGFLVEGL